MPPLKFKSVKILQKKIDAYFENCAEKKIPLTITGLALALDTSRRVLIEYEGKDKYSNTIKKAKMICQNYVEQYLFTGKNVAGAIFNLKNNYGWYDKQEVDVTSKGEKIAQNVFVVPDFEFQPDEKIFGDN